MFLIMDKAGCKHLGLLFVVVFLLKIGIRNEAEVRVLVQRSRRVTRTTMCFSPATAMN